MGDKTQVFPLESIESIRTRLTHSYEVANLARSLGIEIAVSIGQNLPADAIRTLPAKSSLPNILANVSVFAKKMSGSHSVSRWGERGIGKDLRWQKKASWPGQAGQARP